MKAYDVAVKKAISTGQKIDVTLQLVLCGFLFRNEKLIKANLEKATRLSSSLLDCLFTLLHKNVLRFTAIKRALSLCEQGGDWDRRNRLRVYEGTFALMSRDFKLASLRLLVTHEFAVAIV